MHGHRGNPLCRGGRVSRRLPLQRLDVDRGRRPKRVSLLHLGVVRQRLLLCRRRQWRLDVDVQRRQLDGFPPEGSDTVFNAVSCPQGSSFCLAADNEGMYYYTSDAGGFWLGDGTTDSAPTSIYSVSCPTSAVCVTGDTLGNTVSYSGDRWSSPTSIDDNALNSVSVRPPRSARRSMTQARS